LGYQNQIEKLVFAYKKNYEQLLQNINNDKKEHFDENDGILFPCLVSCS
jgi:hypothetical protein